MLSARRVRSVEMLSVVLTLAGMTAGCGSRPRIPTYDAETIAQQALAEYDKNQDGKLDGAELDRCPALKGALAEIDKEKSGFLTAEAIAGRLRDFATSNVAMTAMNCKVLRDGLGVAGVTVTLVPEKFMGDAVKPASGITGPDGIAPLYVSHDFPGVSLGFYRVEVSLKDASGKETLPARYNTNTKLGQEISHSMRGGIVIRLGS
jgi:hypothetical protein